MNVGFRYRFHEIREKFQTVALPIDHPERDQFAPELVQAAIERFTFSFRSSK
jgi:hypothetical protein